MMDMVSMMIMAISMKEIGSKIKNPVSEKKYIKMGTHIKVTSCTIKNKDMVSWGGLNKIEFMKGNGMMVECKE